jgi:hypothetical protein
MLMQGKSGQPKAKDGKDGKGGKVGKDEKQQSPTKGKKPHGQYSRIMPSQRKRRRLIVLFNVKEEGKARLGVARQRGQPPRSKPERTTLTSTSPSMARQSTSKRCRKQRSETPLLKPPIRRCLAGLEACKQAIGLMELGDCELVSTGSIWHISKTGTVTRAI